MGPGARAPSRRSRFVGRSGLPMLILEFLLKRIAQGFLIVCITSFIIFTLLRVVPGDPVRLIVGGMAPPDVVEKVATKMGLRDPIIVQYGRYMRGLLLHGDLGQS